jgi:outer membrane protein TolC
MKKIVSILMVFGLNAVALDINGAVQKALENNYSLKEQQYIVQEQQETLEGSYSGYLPKANVLYSYNDRNKVGMGQLEEDSTLSAVLSYNLFNGLSDMYTIESYKNILKSSNYTFEAAKQDLILSVKVAYTKYLLAQKNTQTMEEAYKLYTVQYKDTQNFFDQGLVAKNELLEVEVQMLQAQQNLQKAKSDEQIAKVNLENIIGVQIKTPLQELGDIPNSLDESLVLLTNNRSEILSLQKVLQSLKNQQKSVQGSFYPKVDAKLGHHRYGDDVSVDGRAGYPDSQNVGTIEVNWNLYNGNSNSAQEKVLQKKIQQVAMRIEDLKQKIQLQYQTALEEYKLSKLNLQTAKKSMESAKINYEIVGNKFKEGLSTNKDLIDANYLLTNSKENYFSSFYNKYIAIATLQRILEESN